MPTAKKITMACLNKMGPFPKRFGGKVVTIKSEALDRLKTTGRWDRTKQAAPPKEALIELSGPGAAALATSYVKHNQAVHYPPLDD